MPISPSELSDEVAKVVALAQDRVKPGSIGATQYYEPETGEQKFETMSMEDFLTYTEEEALDIVNYGVMLYLKIGLLRTRMRERNVRMGKELFRG